MTHMRRDTVNWPGNSGQSSSELNHSILKEEPVESAPNSRSQRQEGEIPSPPSALNSANGSAHAPESPSLSSESITYSRARDALLQLAIPNQNFTAVQHIGEGGQGDSYLLVNQQGEKFKAKILKEVPKKALYCPKEELAENLPEVKYFSKLDIPGVAKVIGAYSVEDPNLGRVVVVVSEYVEGETLQTKIRKLEPEQGLGVSETFNLLVKLSTSLAKLHSDTRNGVGQRVVHGDLKPANIVLSDSGDPTLIDFGSTKAVTPGHTEQFTMGTSSLHSVSPPYSPLEQYLGNRIPASDIYALGVTAIECLLGRIPQELKINPLECPKCHAQMRIIAFIQDEHSIKDIMKSQGIADFRSPPPIPTFIDTTEALDELPSYDSFEPAPDDF